MPSFTVFRGDKTGAPRESVTKKPDELLADNVLVKVTASGVCGTDMHYRTQDMVLGHEGVGIVEQLGPDVKNLKKGDRGDDIFCAERALYGEANFDQGSFASHAVWREAFLHLVPEGLTDEEAAPLQCGGATVFTALLGIKPGETVGILGMGGLGHIAIQFAAKLGCRVVVISGSNRKKEEAMKLGAHRFIAMASKNLDRPDEEWRLQRLLVTASAQPDWERILPLMARKSRIYPLSVSEGKFEIPYMPVILEGITIIGSPVASRHVHRKMLDFASLHQIKPIIEKFPMTEAGIAEAMHKLDQGDMHFRAVLTPQ